MNFYNVFQMSGYPSLEFLVHIKNILISSAEIKSLIQNIGKVVFDYNHNKIVYCKRI